MLLRLDFVTGYFGQLELAGDGETLMTPLMVSAGMRGQTAALLETVDRADAIGELRPDIRLLSGDIATLR